MLVSEQKHFHDIYMYLTAQKILKLIKNKKKWV